MDDSPLISLPFPVPFSEWVTSAEFYWSTLAKRPSSLIRTRGLAHIQNGLIDAGIPVLETELNERDAFKAIFSFQQTLHGLNAADVPNLDKAKTNVEEFAREILARLTAEEGGREREANEITKLAGAA